MKDEVLKQLKKDVLTNIEADIATLWSKKYLEDITVKYNTAKSDNSCIELYFTISFDLGKTWKSVVITIDNYVFLPYMCNKLDTDAKIPPKNYYPPAVGEERKDISDLTRIRTRILWIVLKALQHYTQLAMWGNTTYDGREFNRHKIAIVEVDTIGEIKYSYND